MIPGSGPVVQALLGTFLTWGLTAAGSALVFVFSSGQVSAGIGPSSLASPQDPGPRAVPCSWLGWAACSQL